MQLKAWGQFSNDIKITHFKLKVSPNGERGHRGSNSNHRRNVIIDQVDTCTSDEDREKQYLNEGTRLHVKDLGLDEITILIYL